MKDKYVAFDLKVELENDKKLYRLYGYKKVSLEEARVLLANNINKNKPNPLLEFIEEFESIEKVNEFMNINDIK